jgi:hypothetical protein
MIDSEQQTVEHNHYSPVKRGQEGRRSFLRVTDAIFAVKTNVRTEFHD